MPSEVRQVERIGKTELKVQITTHFGTPLNFWIDFESGRIRYKDGWSLKGWWKDVEIGEFIGEVEMAKELEQSYLQLRTDLQECITQGKQLMEYNKFLKKIILELLGNADPNVAKRIIPLLKGKEHHFQDHLPEHKEVAQ